MPEHGVRFKLAGAEHSLRVFICGIIQGSRGDISIHEQSYRERLRHLLKTRIPRAEIYCPVSLHPESPSYDDAMASRVLEESVEAAKKSQLLVAYLPEASMGSAIELWEAKRAGAKVVSITPLKDNWVVRYASDIVVADLEEFESLLASPAFERLLQ
jgi:hypothetical protein